MQIRVISAFAGVPRRIGFILAAIMVLASSPVWPAAVARAADPISCQGHYHSFSPYSDACNDRHISQTGHPGITEQTIVQNAERWCTADDQPPMKEGMGIDRLLRMEGYPDDLSQEADCWPS